MTSLHPLLKRVEFLLDTALRSDVSLLDKTNRTLRERPGKMLRPALTLLCAGAAGGVTDDSIRFAAASELLHNATLLHDDVVDGASSRRGRPTVSSLLGGSASVLIGDFWLVKCMQCILESERYGNRVIRIFAKTLSDLAEGELLQMEKSSLADTSLEDYLRIIYCKTASLFEAAALSGAISAGAPEETVQKLGEFARCAGLAFQIKDDIMDYTSVADEIGKPVGIDLLEQKITLPLLCAMEKAGPEAEASIRKKVADISSRPELAAEVRDFVLENVGVALATEKMNFYIGKAKSCLDYLEDSREKSYLAFLASYIGGRKK